MPSMPLLLLPDLFAISFLTVVLALVHRRFRHEAGGMWTVGLLFIVAESVAHLLYVAALPPDWHRAMHAVALDDYFLAGIVFLRSAVPGLRRMQRGVLYFLLNTLTPIVAITLYGFDVKRALTFHALAAAGLLIGLVSALLLRRGWRHLLFFVIGWLPWLIAGNPAGIRAALYIDLAMLYAAVAVCFYLYLVRESRARLLIAAGFSIWALCFVTHPWVASWGSVYAQFASQVWDMQKILITLGFVLRLFEQQVSTNEWLALHDQLTGLPNRRLFDDRLSQAITRSERNGTSFILFNMDLDGFKQINDTHGHPTGDAVLRQIALSLQTAVRKTDTLARMGGDEFTLLAVDMPSRSGTGAPASRTRKRENSIRGSARFARHTAKRFEPIAQISTQDTLAAAAAFQHRAERIAADLRFAVECPVTVDTPQGEQVLQLFTSIGFAVYPEDTVSITELYRIADRRMYQDKEAATHGSHVPGRKPLPHAPEVASAGPGNGSAWFPTSSAQL